MPTNVTYVYDIAEKITAVKVDGTAMTERASIADVESNFDSFFSDVANGKLYVACDENSNLFDISVVAVARINVASKEKLFGADYYDPRMTGIPKLSMRIEKTFGGVGQISIGALDVANNDGEWDGRAEYLWANADTNITLKIGYDTRTDAMAYGDYTALGTWGVDKWTTSDNRFSLSLREKKSRIEAQIPTEVFDKTTYPNLDDDDVGEVIPRAYGKVYGARPILIDAATKTFKVANHAIKSLDEIRLLIDEAWTASSFTTTDLDNGEFTCDSWVEGNEVAVDFQGRVNADDTLMDNAADVVEDLMLYAGIAAADIDSSALAVAWARLDNGVFSTGLRATQMALSLYLNESESLADIIARINAAVGSYFYVSPSGQFTYSVFWPEAGNDLESFDSSACLAFTPTIDAVDLASKVNVKYAPRLADEWWRLKSAENTGNQYDHLVTVADVLIEEIPELSEPDDAEHWAQRHLVSDGRPRKTYKITLPAMGLDIVPGTQLHVQNSRRGFDEVLDVLSVEADFGDGVAMLVCSLLRNWGRDSGLWGAASITFPSLLGGATITAWDDTWTDAQKAWARQNVGFWTNDNGFADATDPASFNISNWF